MNVLVDMCQKRVPVEPFFVRHLTIFLGRLA